MIDSHCHLDREPLINNINEVLIRSKNVGIKKLLTICTTLKSFENIKNILIDKKVETNNTEAYEYYLKGLYRLQKTENIEDKEIARGLFEKAIELKEQFPQVIFLYDKNNLFEQRITSQLNNPYFSKSMFLIDSFSNLMEEFNVNLSFSEIFEDLKVLL